MSERPLSAAAPAATTRARAFVSERPFAVTVWSAAASCALAPAYTVRWHYGPFPTTLLETAILVTFIVFAIEVYLARPAPAWRTPFTIPAGVFLFAGAVAVVVSPEQVKQRIHRQGCNGRHAERPQDMVP